MTSAIVIGANSAIALSCVEQLLNGNTVDQVVAVSRTANPVLQAEFGARLQWLLCDYSEPSIKSICTTLATEKDSFSHVIICNGILHTEKLAPEKRLEDIKTENLQAIFLANTITPMLWLANLAAVLKSKQPCRVAVFSARVGSIADNKAGGWYGYRASKAALNMLLRTANIEYQWRASNVRLFAFHPGTTDTQLSKPFQASVPAGKLFTAEFVAGSLLSIMANLDEDASPEFLDWAGKPVDW